VESSGAPAGPNRGCFFLGFGGTEPFLYVAFFSDPANVTFKQVVLSP